MQWLTFSPIVLLHSVYTPALSHAFAASFIVKGMYSLGILLSKPATLARIFLNLTLKLHLRSSGFYTLRCWKHTLNNCLYFMISFDTWLEFQMPYFRLSRGSRTFASLSSWYQPLYLTISMSRGAGNFILSLFIRVCR